MPRSSLLLLCLTDPMCCCCRCCVCCDTTANHLGDEPAAAAGPYLSLPRLQLWLDEPLRRMRLLASLVDSCAGSGGGLLAGGVWAATNVGDPLARSYAVRILHQVRC
jgi:gamma-tubulin complex component 3